MDKKGGLKKSSKHRVGVHQALKFLPLEKKRWGKWRGRGGNGQYLKTQEPKTQGNSHLCIQFCSIFIWETPLGRWPRVTQVIFNSPVSCIIPGQRSFPPCVCHINSCLFLTEWPFCCCSRTISGRGKRKSFLLLSGKLSTCSRELNFNSSNKRQLFLFFVFVKVAFEVSKYFLWKVNNCVYAGAAWQWGLFLLSYVFV